MSAFVDTHRQRFGVEPICKVLQIAPSGYHRRVAQIRNPALLSTRSQRDAVLVEQIKRVWHLNYEVYGVKKVWRQLKRDGMVVACCTVERLMQRLGLHGVRRGQAVRTTVSHPATICPQDHVNRQFKAERPNQLWVSDFTYVSTWQGFVYVAFVIDVYARLIVGWRVSRHMRTDFVLDALEQALYARKPDLNSLIHHSDRGVQYVSIRYTERLAEAGIEPSVGSKGDSDDNALAETINGLYKAEVIHRRGPWKTTEAVEIATLEWVSWFNHHRLLEPIGYIPPAEAEAMYYHNKKAQQQGQVETA
jgi:putative transposase